MALISFIRPATVLPKDSLGATQGFPPLGMAYLIAALKSGGHKVNAIDGFGEATENFYAIKGTNFLINGLNNSEILEKVPTDADAFCISCGFSNEWINTKKLIQEISKVYPGTPIVLGGEHASCDSVNILGSAPEVSVCVIGEGEETLLEVIKAIEEKKNFRGIDGIAHLDSNGNYTKENTRKRIRSVDELAWPSWDEIPLENYFDGGYDGGSLNFNSIPMLATRGCPYKCTFCSNPAMWGSAWVPRNPKKIIEEIKSYIKKYKIQHVNFFDLTTIINKKWIINFCQLLISENLGITWSMPSGTRAEVLDFKVLSLLKQSGLLKMDYAPETGSIATAKRIKKRVNLDKMSQSIKMSIKLDITCGATLIFGFPGQTKSEAFGSLFFALKMAFIGLYDLACFPFTPYPGSELFYDLVKSGRIDCSSENYDNFLVENLYNRPTNMRSWSDHVPNLAIPFFVMGTMALFYSLQFVIRPFRFFTLVKRLRQGKPITSLELILYGMYLNFIKGRKTQIKAVVS